MPLYIGKKHMYNRCRGYLRDAPLPCAYSKYKVTVVFRDSHESLEGSFVLDNGSTSSKSYHMHPQSVFELVNALVHLSFSSQLRLHSFESQMAKEYTHGMHSLNQISLTFPNLRKYTNRCLTTLKERQPQ